MRKEDITSYERRLRLMINQILLEGDSPRERKLTFKPGGSKMKKLSFMLLGLGLVLMLAANATAVLTTQYLKRREGPQVADEERLERIKEVIQEKNAKDISKLQMRVNKKTASKKAPPKGTVIARLIKAVANPNSKIKDNSVTNEEGDKFTVEEKEITIVTKKAEKTERAEKEEKEEPPVHLSKKSVTQQSLVKKESISPEDTEFKGSEEGMRTIAHVWVEYNEKGQRIKETREGTRSGITDEGDEINEAFFQETVFRYNNLGLVEYTQTISQSEGTDWVEIVQEVYNTKFNEFGLPVEQIIDQWQGEKYSQLIRTNIIYEDGEMVEWDEEVIEESAETA